jgi:hypothetical protein
MAVMGHELMDQYFVQRRERLGELVMHAKRQMVRELKEGEQAAQATRHLLDSIATVISPAPELLDAERREHVLMFNLLGDPLLRLDHPHEIAVTTVEEATAGSAIQVRGTTAIHGRCTVELICRRDRLKTRFVARPQYDPRDEALANYTTVYAQANDRQWTSSSFACTAESFETTLQVPDDAQGPCHVRVFVEGADSCGLGAAGLYIRGAVLTAGPQ